MNVENDGGSPIVCNEVGSAENRRLSLISRVVRDPKFLSGYLSKEDY